MVLEKKKSTTEKTSQDPQCDYDLWLNHWENFGQIIENFFEYVYRTLNLFLSEVIEYKIEDSSCQYIC